MAAVGRRGLQPHCTRGALEYNVARHYLLRFTMPQADRWLSVAESAKLSGYNPEYIRRLIRSGKIKARKFVTVWQVDRLSLISHLRESKKAGRGPRFAGS